MKNSRTALARSTGSPGRNTRPASGATESASRKHRRSEATTPLPEVNAPNSAALPVMCQMHGQAYLAGTEMGRSIDSSKEYVRVLCIYPKGNIG